MTPTADAETPPASPRPALLLLVPLLVERAAVAGATTGALVVTTGMGRRRALAGAGRGARTPASAVAVAGLCGGLTGGLLPGDVVVATGLAVVDEAAGDRGGGRRSVAGLRAHEGPVSSEPLVAALRARGLRRVHTGVVVSSPRIVHGADRERLAARGAIVVDMESAWLAGAAAGRPFAVLRIVLDAPGGRAALPLAATRGLLEALCTLRRAAPALSDWAVSVGDRGV